MASELDEDGAIRIVTANAQAVLSFCSSDAERQRVCVRLARLFSDYGQEFSRRSSVTKPEGIPKVAASTIAEGLSRADTEKRRPSWMAGVGDERPTDPAGLVNYEPVLKKDQR